MGKEACSLNVTAADVSCSADTYFKQNNLMNYLVSVPYSKVKAKEVVCSSLPRCPNQFQIHH